MARNKQRVFSEYQPDNSIEFPYPELESSQWSSLGESLYILVQNTLGNRAGLDQQLDVWNSYYEMREAYGSDDTPTPESPNPPPPIVATAVDEFASRISGSAILPRPYLVRGNDPVASDNAHIVEQFYNNEWQKNGWEQSIRTSIHLAARDGTSIMGVFWETKIIERIHRIDQQKPDGTTGKVNKRVKTVQYDAPKLFPVELRDFLLFPAHAISIEEADGVAHKMYMSEPQLQAMVNSGVLDDERVERALSFTNTAQGDLTYDQQGYSTYEINNLINVADTAVAAPEGIKMNRGPIRVWKIHTNLYDLDGDGVTEENVFWLHDQSHILLGYAPYEYWGRRPYFEYAPLERPNRFYGISIPSRVEPYYVECRAQQLMRLTVLDKILTQPYVRASGVKLPAEDQKTAELNIITIPKDMGPNPISLFPVPEYPSASLQEQQYLTQQAERVVGAPQTSGSPPGSGSSGGMSRGSARQAQLQAAMQSQQTNMVLSRTRTWMLDIFQFIHLLYKQYGPDQMSVVNRSQEGVNSVTLPKEILNLDYTLGIAGQGGPLDKERTQELWQTLYQLVIQNPIVQSNPQLLYNAFTSLLETYDIPEITRIAGTMEDVKKYQEQQAAAAQAQQQAELMKQVLSHTNVKGGGSAS